jgi:hypothetical protein
LYLRIGTSSEELDLDEKLEVVLLCFAVEEESPLEFF